MAHPIAILSGLRSGRLLVTDVYRRTSKGRIEWLCRCDCGAEKWVLRINLRNGTVTSCGCANRERIATIKLDPAEKKRRRYQRTRRWIADNKERNNATKRISRARRIAADPEAARERWRIKEAKRRITKGPEWVAEKQRKAYLRQREKRLEYARQQRLAVNPEMRRCLYRESYKRRKEANPLQWQEKRRQWRENNRGLVRARNTARKAKIKIATPPWVNLAEIAAIYQNCDDGYHVDHIVPIRGLTAEGYRVSGLHVPWNLQYLPEQENLRKLTRIQPEDPVYGINIRRPRI